MGVVTAYQTLEDLDNIDEIEMSGPFPSTHNKTWLGAGCYLWDTDFQWALDWGKTAYTDKGKRFVISRCEVDLSQGCFDLFGCVKDRLDLIAVLDVMIEKNVIKDKKDAYLSEVIQYMKNQGIFDYRSIRAYDNYNKDVKIQFRRGRFEYMNLNQRVQICVIRKKDVILQPIKVIFPEIYVT
ncbi:MAG: hypothetical protein ACYC2P_06375 [Paludibacteraceae bacterium]